MPRYEVRPVGEHAKLGEVPAADVGKLLLGAQSVVARAAGATVGRTVKRTGRWERVIEDATRLRLWKLRRGSVIAEFEMPYSVPHDDELQFDVAALGDQGWDADFEKKTAHVRTGMQDLVELVFDDDLSDEIYEALRERSEFEGDVSYDPITKSMKSVRLRHVTRAEQFLLGSDAEAFWRDRSAHELIAEQGKVPVTSFEGLRDDSLSDEDFANFLSSFG